MKRVLSLAPFAILLFILPFPKTVALRLACLGFAVIVTVLQWRKNAPPPALPARWPIGLWIAVSLVSLVYAIDPAYSAGELKNEIGYAMAAYIVFFVSTREDSDLKVWILALSAGTAVLSVWALGDRLVSGAWNEGGPYGGTASFATYAATILPLLILGAFRCDTLLARRAALIASILLLVGALASQQRIVWLVVLLQAVVALWLLRASGIVRWSPRTVIVSVVAVAAVSIAVLGFTQATRFKEGGVGVTAHIGEGRLEQWSKVVERIEEHPLTGAGFGRLAMKKEYPDLIPAASPLLWHAHNLVLNYGLEMGVPGIAAIFAVFLGLAYEYAKFLRVRDPGVQALGIAGICIVVGVLLRNQSNDLFLRDMSILFWACNGALLGLGARKRALRGAA
jgi:O-antigen ligase